MKENDLLRGLPGEPMIRAGLADLHSRRESVPACLVEMARPRLTRAGFLSPDHPAPIPEPELRLYRLLRQQPGDAYARYNALRRELVSFEQALDHRTKGGQVVRL